MSKIVLEHASLRLPTGRAGEIEILRGASLSISEGEFVCLLGPSGCGKTTLMNLMAGFLRPTSGSVLIDGQEVSAPDPRHVTLFQEHALFPWRTALDNVVFGLEAKGVSRADARSRALEYLALVGLADFAHAHPQELSGGMRQRVALARALAVEPDVLFMDEPFSALDTFTRSRLQDELLRIWHLKRQTIVFVTHDLDEAVYLADRIVLMESGPGRIRSSIQVGLPRPCRRDDPRLAQRRKALYREFALLHEAPSAPTADEPEEVLA